VQGSLSTRLSRRERRLYFLYEDELRRAGGRLLPQLEALAAFFTWLHARGVELGAARPRDLAAYRRALPALLARAGRRRGARQVARQLSEVRDFFRFLSCRGHLRHDPGAALETPQPAARR
jgi:site-specific recombinase XerD